MMRKFFGIYVGCLLAVCLSVIGCSKGPSPSVKQRPVGPKFVFFDGQAPLAPSKWAGVTAGAAEAGDISLLKTLRLLELLQVHQRGEPIADEVNRDSKTIIELGKSDHLQIQWNGSKRECNAILRDDLLLNDGTVIDSSILCLYLGAIINNLNLGFFDSNPHILELADSMLRFGYAVYASDSKAESERARIQILLASWSVAAVLRERHNLRVGLLDEAARWRSIAESDFQIMRKHLMSSFFDRIGCEG